MSWVNADSYFGNLPVLSRDRSAPAVDGRSVSAAGAVPWLIVGLGQVRVWDPTAGLVPVPGLGPPDVDRRQASLETTIGPGCLSPDGTTLWYYSSARDAVYDLLESRRTLLQVSRFPRGDNRRVFSGPAGDALEVEYPSSIRTESDLPTRFFVQRNDKRTELPVPGPPALTRSGPSVQFMRAGSAVAIGSEHWPQTDLSTTIVDLISLEVKHFDGYAVTTHGSWTPNGRRLLVTRGWEDFSPLVLDVASGSARELAPLIEHPYVDRGDYAWDVAGWVDNTRVMVSRVKRRRLEVATFDVDSGERVDVVDVPARPHSTLEFAPWAAQDNPASIGRVDPPAATS